MFITDAIDTIMELAIMKHCDISSRVRVHIGNQLYDVDHIDTVIDMDNNRPNVVIHVKEN